MYHASLVSSLDLMTVFFVDVMLQVTHGFFTILELVFKCDDGTALAFAVFSDEINSLLTVGNLVIFPFTNAFKNLTACSYGG